MKLDKETRKLSKQLFQYSFTDGKLDDQKVSQVAGKIVERKPRHAVGLFKAYQRLVRLEVEKHHALIESATQLDSNTVSQLESNLKAKYGDSLVTEFRITPELLGGIRIKIGSDVYDSSVRERLNRLEAIVAHA